MCIDTASAPSDFDDDTRTITRPVQHWRPYGAIALVSVWLGFVALIAIALCSCDASTSTRPCSSASAAIALSCPSPTPMGGVALAWSITKNGQPSNCFQAGAHGVGLRLRNHAGGALTFAGFTCDGSPGITQVAPGVYDVAIALHDAKGATIATVPNQTSFSVTADRVTTLAPVTFALNPSTPPGSVQLTIKAPPFAQNCTSAVSGGAAITGTSITITRPDGSCAPITLVRSIGGAQVGTYPIDCTTPVVAPCVENTETLTTSALTPGTYSVHVRGKLDVNPNECWVNDATIVVPPAGAPPLIQTLNLALQSAPC